MIEWNAQARDTGNARRPTSQRGTYMNKSDLAAAIANTSAIPMAEAANAVEFVFHIMSNQPWLSEAAMPRPANSNVPTLEQLVLFEELAERGARPTR